MNISPSDTDVRQGFTTAGTIAAAQDQAGAQTAKQTDAQAAVPAQVAAAAQNGAPQADGRQQNASTDAAQQSEAEKAAQAKAAKEAADLLGQQLNKSNTGLKIKVLDDDQRTIQVEVVDEKSNKVLRKIPQDEIIKLSASIRAMNVHETTGVLIDKPT